MTLALNFLMFLLCLGATILIVMGGMLTYQAIQEFLDEQRSRKRRQARERERESGVK